MAGKGNAIVLKSSHNSIDAKRGSLAIITADIVDASRNHIYGARPALRWEISGPATLVGPDIYTSDFDKKEELEGTLYIDAPVSNVIRSTGEPDDITVTVSSDGLKSDKIIIKANAIFRDTSSVKDIMSNTGDI
jgi:hypothetical protein